MILPIQNSWCSIYFSRNLMIYHILPILCSIIDLPYILPFYNGYGSGTAVAIPQPSPSSPSSPSRHHPAGTRCRGYSRRRDQNRLQHLRHCPRGARAARVGSEITGVAIRGIRPARWSWLWEYNGCENYIHINIWNKFDIIYSTPFLACTTYCCLAVNTSFA